MVRNAPYEEALHWFDISSNNDPNLGVDGVNGMLNAYSNTVPNLDFSSPTNFAEVLSHAISIADDLHRSNKDHIPNPQYSILLIITDGEISDFEETKDWIVYAANEDLPLSIVIVGVGRVNYDKMKKLDGDGKNRLKSLQYGVASRDIVQFVAFQDKRSVEDLAAETLEEIPDQFLQYMHKYRFEVPKGRQYGEHS
uniref:Copine C-terminal domain-containing protein n=1 Tax=Spongospora subterranea TaxID=70186 RepID=A0A0H5QVD3_9EUKA|eukprot:CRZ05556.1 hypothetical protein [Spongospora subterranea]